MRSLYIISTLATAVAAPPTQDSLNGVGSDFMQVTEAWAFGLTKATTQPHLLSYTSHLLLQSLSPVWDTGENEMSQPHPSDDIDQGGEEHTGNGLQPWGTEHRSRCPTHVRKTAESGGGKGYL